MIAKFIKKTLIKIPLVIKQIEKIAYFNYVRRGYTNGFDKKDWLEAENEFYIILFLKGVIYPIIIGFLVALSWHLFDVIKPYNIYLSQPYVGGKVITYNAPLLMHREDELRVGILNKNVRSLKNPILILRFPQGLEIQPVNDEKEAGWKCWEPNRVYFMPIPYSIYHKFCNSLVPLRIKFPDEGIYTLQYIISGEDLVTIHRLIRIKVTQ